jgi:quinol monooxygenase YgiN
MLVSRESNLITLINVFETKPEQQQVLLDQLRCFAESVVKDEPACIGAALHRSTNGTRVVNYAQWRPQEDLDCFARDTSRANASPAPASLAPVTNQHTQTRSA